MVGGRSGIYRVCIYKYYAVSESLYGLEFGLQQQVSLACHYHCQPDHLQLRHTAQPHQFDMLASMESGVVSPRGRMMVVPWR